MIFYFSGTGNSECVAQKIAGSTGDRLISVSDALNRRECSFAVTDDEHIGFVFPTYFFGVPSIVIDFIDKLEMENYTGQYVYCITTCGGDCGDLLNQFGELLLKKGIKLNGGSQVALPDNYILLFNLLPKVEKQKELFIQANKDTDLLISQIKNKHLPVVKSGVGKCLKTLFTYPIYKYGRRTKHFYAVDTCNGCKLCQKICPANIIEIDDGRPVWTKERCIQCLACLHRCPQKAIQHKKRTEKRDRYKNMIRIFLLD